MCHGARTDSTRSRSIRFATARKISQASHARFPGTAPVLGSNARIASTVAGIGFCLSPSQSPATERLSASASVAWSRGFGAVPPGKTKPHFIDFIDPFERAIGTVPVRVRVYFRVASGCGARSWSTPFRGFRGRSWRPPAAARVTRFRDPTRRSLRSMRDAAWKRPSLAAGGRADGVVRHEPSLSAIA